MNGTDNAEPLPDGWSQATLSEVASINPGKPKYEGAPDDLSVGFIPMSAVDADSGTVTAVQPRALADVRDKSYRTFATHDVLFAKITPCMENGKSAIVPGLPNGHGFGSTEFHVLRAREGLDPRYLWRFVRQESYRAAAEPNMIGSVGQLRVPADFIRNSQLLVPPPAEQARIVVRLEEIEARRRAIAAHLEAGQRVVERFRGAVLAAACSGRLTEGWRESNPEVKADELRASLLASRPSAKQRRTNNASAHGLTSKEQLNRLPSTWELVRLGDILDVATGGTPLRTNEAYYQGGTIPWVTSGAVNAGTITTPTELITPLALQETSVKLFPAGTLLIAMYGEGQTRGRVAELAIETGTNQAVAAVIFPEDTAPMRAFIRLFFEDSYRRIRALSVGGVQPNLNLGIVRDTLIPLPSLEEQRAIVSRARAALATAQRLTAQIDRTALALRRASEASLAKAFRGELVPTEAALAREEASGFESAAELRVRLE